MLQNQNQNLFLNQPNIPSKVINRWVLAFMAVALITHLSLSLGVGFNNLLTDLHGFRQCQTAISVFWMLKETGLTLNYLTPVVAPPWQLPFEFPLYQWLVYIAIKIFHSPLDQTGRAVSLVAFYGCLITLFGILKGLGLNLVFRRIAIALICLHPVYLFWSRSFMIESTALLLALLFVFFSMKYFRHAAPQWLVLASIFGCLAVAEKVTTCFVAALPLTVIFLVAYFNNLEGTKQKLVKFGSYIIACGAVPLLALLWWTGHADATKAANPLAASCVSKAMATFNFGTVAAKTSALTWQRILTQSGYGWPGILTALGCIAILILLKEKRLAWFSSVCILAYLLVPAVFTNLYFVHNYYQYASVFLVTIPFAGLASGLLAQNTINIRWVGAVAIALIATFTLVQYKRYYWRFQSNNDLMYQPIWQAINQSTLPNQHILISGMLFSSIIPYYAQRKAIMLPTNEAFKPFQQVTSAMPNAEIGAIVTLNPTGEPLLDSLYNNVTHYGFSATPNQTWVGLEWNHSQTGALFLKAK